MRGIHKWGCRCSERLRAQAGGGQSLTHIWWGGVMGILWRGKLLFITTDKARSRGQISKGGAAVSVSQKTRDSAEKTMDSAENQGVVVPRPSLGIAV
jgi:hypothetical protein